MRQGMQIAGVVVALAGTGAAGYWLGGRDAAPAPPMVAAAPAASAAPAGQRKLLYYRNPMGLPDTSPVPKKDSMGMDYIPVYEGEDASDGGLRISAAKVQKLGVRTEPAALRELGQAVRAAGRVEIDESRIQAVSPKFEGWVERLHVNTTGQPVGRGQPLFEVYSPELVSAQREYAVAARGLASLKEAPAEAQGAMRQLAEASLQRLRNWDISDEQIKALAAGGEPRRTLSFRSPAGGVVLEKKALAGMRFAPGEALYQIADISSVWVVAEVFERDIAAVRSGQKARVTINAYPGKVFEGRVGYIYPTLKAETRTVPVRVELANPGGLLKPAMYASVDFATGKGSRVVSVPVGAVIDSGARQVVFVEKGEGRFEPREVKLGARSDDYVEVREGVAEGEPVVVAANFLIDAESNLKSALGGFGGGDAAKSAGHRADGTLEAIHADGVTVRHGPVASLKWPAMTMDFVLANPSLAAQLKPGAPIAFEFVERKAGEWVITKIDAAGHGGH